MLEQSLAFLDHLTRKARIAFPEAHLTLTSIHPDRRHPVPSRHIPLNDTTALHDAVEKLLCANQQGYGAFVGIGLRRGNLGRWRRGGVADVLALPALFVDIDAPPDEALKRLNQRDPPPSCIVHSGYGIHAYWWLDEPITDLTLATRALKYLRQQYSSDTVSVASSMRLPGSINTKPNRHNAPCTLHCLRSKTYPLSAFKSEWSHPRKTDQTGQTGHSGHSRSTKRRVKHDRFSTPRELNPRLIETVCRMLERHYEGYWRQSGWLASRCPLPHEHDHPGAHFSFNPAIGLGVCMGKHGRMLLKDLCDVLGISPVEYGGVYSASSASG